jgi:hypothetical protein
MIQSIRKKNLRWGILYLAMLAALFLVIGLPAGGIVFNVITTIGKVILIIVPVYFIYDNK